MFNTFKKWKAHKNNCYIWFSLTLSLLLVGCSIGIGMGKFESPDYEVKSSFEKIEIREYSHMVIAEVTVEGDRKQSVGDGFRLLADYIFGNNIGNEKIAMTAPVKQQQSFENNWQISFVMPSAYSMSKLPKPQNNSVKIKEVPARKCVSIQFSGGRNDKNLDKNLKKLMNYIKENKIQVVGSPVYAFYNPPWTPPFMRRNEIMFEVNQ